MSCLLSFDRVIRKDYQAYIQDASFELMLPDSTEWLDGDIIDYLSDGVQSIYSQLLCLFQFGKEKWL